LIQAENLSVPDQMQAAQRHLVFALTMRRDGIAVIARQIQPALGTTTNRDAINAIAGATAHFYASDVVYKAYAVPEIAGALAAAGIPVGGVGGQAINGGQFLPALGWLHPSFIAGRLGSKLPGARGVNSNAPGRHGHSLDSVSVGSNTMSTAATNHVAANPAPTFTLSVTNGGQFNQFGIGCRVAITGLNDTGTGTIAETTPGQTTSTA
jgi:hypothetical protein